MRKVFSGRQGVQIGDNQFVTDLMFADDSAIFANTDAEANDILRIIAAIALPYRLTVNAEKAKALTTDGSPCTLYLHNSQIEQVAEFKHLGSIAQQNKASCTAEIHSRIGKAAMTFGSLTWCLWRRHNVSLATKMRVFRSIVMPILLYGDCLVTRDLLQSNTATLKELIPGPESAPISAAIGKDEYGEAAKISGPNQPAQIEKDYDDDLYLQRPHARIVSIHRGLTMQSRKIKYDVIELTETRRHHPLHAAYDSGEELFLGTCDSGGVGGVGILVNTHLAMNIDSCESLTSRIGRLRLKRCGSVPALTAFVAYAPTSDYDDEDVEVFYVELEEFSKGDHTFSTVTSAPRSPHEGHRKNFTSEPTIRSGTSKERNQFRIELQGQGKLLEMRCLHVMAGTRTSCPAPFAPPFSEGGVSNDSPPEKMREARLRWYGHVLRGKKDSVRKVGLKFEVVGKRPRGRLKHRWSDTLHMDLKVAGVGSGEVASRHQNSGPRYEAVHMLKKRKKKKNDWLRFGGF
ncbi:unnamed protein product [Heligmosomoides polygyrus]|uniref:Reverse transcriptase domain-containing protein n=1 Tax=Heligmosomoides polygyrus TaxID=6339 RepID=A0A183F2S9_HELPZ|nr:unnamed protein product [Heligmosomoides polygyrus]